jgi:hypothetical protein
VIRGDVKGQRFCWHCKEAMSDWFTNTSTERLTECLGAGHARFAAPVDVLRDPDLTPDQKREVLFRWAFDAYRIELGVASGAAPRAASRLDEVIDALIDLDGNLAALWGLARA